MFYPKRVLVDACAEHVVSKQLVAEEIVVSIHARVLRQSPSGGHVGRNPENAIFGVRAVKKTLNGLRAFGRQALQTIRSEFAQQRRPRWKLEDVGFYTERRFDSAAEIKS